MEADTSIEFFPIFAHLLHQVTLQRPSRSKVLIHGPNSTDNQKDFTIQEIFNHSVMAGECVGVQHSPTLIVCILSIIRSTRHPFNHSPFG